MEGDFREHVFYVTIDGKRVRDDPQLSRIVVPLKAMFK